MHHNASSMTFIINLAVCDLAYCSIHLPIYAAQYLTRSPILNEPMCKFTVIFRNIITYADYMSIGMIALSRCINVTTKKKVIDKYSVLFTIGIWVYATLIFLPEICPVRYLC